MAVLQACQAELLKELDEGEGITPEAVKELRRATDLALRATKHTTRAVARSMAGMVTVAQPHRYKRKRQIFSHGCPDLQGWTVWRFSHRGGGEIQGSEAAISRFPPADSAQAQGNRATSDAGGALVPVFQRGYRDYN